ncbi:MAG: hypothetical protein ACM3QS_18595 [Bacteroidota bacterium]
MRVPEIWQFCREGLLPAAIGQMNLSARGCHRRVLNLARTIAGLRGAGKSSGPSGRCAAVWAENHACVDLLIRRVLTAGAALQQAG